MKFAVSLLVLLTILVFASSAFSAVVTQTDTLYPGYNMIGLQGVPIDPAPTSIFPSDMRLDGRLYRWTAATQSLDMYDEFMPDSFGNLLLGEGYGFISDEVIPRTYSYSALDDTETMDIWISMPKAGLTQIASPYGYSFPWQDVKVTDGNVTVSMQVASKVNNWLQSTAFYWNAAEQSSYDVGIPEDWPSSLDLLPKHGYSITSYVDKLALIFEAKQL